MAALNAYEANLLALDAEADAVQLEAYRSGLAAVMALSAGAQSALAGVLSGAGITLSGFYAAVTCDGSGNCTPDALPGGKPLSEGFVVLTGDAKALNEPFSGAGDLDGDGVDNATEYANVLDAGGATDDFVNAAADAELNGTEGGGEGEPPKTSGCHAGTNNAPLARGDVLAAALLLLMLLFRRRGIASPDPQRR